MNRIKSIRKQVGVTQGELAHQLSWGQSRIGNYESGVRVPTLNDSRRVVQALNDLGASTSLDEVFPPDPHYPTKEKDSRSAA